MCQLEAYGIAFAVCVADLTGHLRAHGTVLCSAAWIHPSIGAAERHSVCSIDRFIPVWHKHAMLAERKWCCAHGLSAPAVSPACTALCWSGAEPACAPGHVYCCFKELSACLVRFKAMANAFMGAVTTCLICCLHGVILWRYAGLDLGPNSGWLCVSPSELPSCGAA